MTEGPKLLVEWSSPWQEFRSAIRPALGRSPAALAGETPIGLFPLRGILVTWGGEAILLALAIILPAKLALLQPFRAPTLPKQHEVIYYHGTELPQVQDFGGAQMGKSGRAGGDEGFHKTQTLKVARGSSPTEKVVDAPNLKLPVSPFPVANLLALKPIPGPPPSEGLKSSTPPVFSKNAIIAPPPETLRELRPTPQLNSSIVPPPSSAVADRSRQVMGLSTPIVAPAPNDIPREQSHALVSMNSPIVQPSPADVQREAPPMRGPAASNSSVVPPPVSAPQRENAQAAKLNMPAAAVIAPPPSQVTNDRTVTGASLSDPKIVPPPVQLGGRSQDPRAIVGMSASTQIVPPPPGVDAGSALNGGGQGHNQKAGGFGTVLSADNVVPPPPSFASDGGGRNRGNGRNGSIGSTEVVPPPPSISGTSDRPTGHGSGTRGGGLGGPLDAGSVLAPPSPAGGTGSGKGVVVSSQPGSTLGLPGNGSAGSIAMSPSGNAKSGLGGSGGGAGIGHGNGPGSGMSGEGSGAAKSGTGKGSDPNSRGGISPYPGPGGAGNGTNGQPPAPGVSIAGGSTSTITLPSFGSPDSGDSTVPGRSPTAGKRRGLDVTVEGTSRSGGAFNFYGMLRGDKVYTKYIPTDAGTVVMQFADASSAKRLYSQDLTGPEPILANLTVALNHSRIIIRCQLNNSGLLRDFHQIEADPGAPTGKVIAALAAWKFTPALRGNDPVEVSVLLGFNIDTR